MGAPFEDQLEALGADLVALDEDEARAALKEIQEKIERLRRHAERLRVALELRTAWIAATAEATSTATADVRVPQPVSNGRKRPKTRDVLIAAFQADPTR